jgi:type IV pilus assembly protein PilE
MQTMISMNIVSQRNRRHRSPSASGFTLIELMIVVVVVSVLAAIAFPSFMDSIRKSRRSEAFTALNNVQQAQERYRGNNSTYTTNLTAAPTATPSGLGLTALTPGGYYTVSIASADATSYTATAIAVSGTTQASDTKCSKLGVRLTGGNIEYAGAGGSGSLVYAPTNICWSR